VDDLVPAPVEHLAQVVGLHREGAGCEFKARLSVWKPEYEDPHRILPSGCGAVRVEREILGCEAGNPPPLGGGGCQLCYLE
jgi:hypothetical protein